MLSNENENKIKQYYTVKDIANEFQVTEKAVRGFIKSGKLNAGKMFGKWVVSSEDLKVSYIKSREELSTTELSADGEN